MAKSIRNVEALTFALVKSGKMLSKRDNSHYSYALKLFILVCTELEYYQPISSKRIIRCLSDFSDIDRLIRCQDHLLRVIRSLEPVDPLVVEEACLGFILPTLRAWEHKHRIKYFRTINTIAQFLKNVLLKDIDDDQDLESFASFQHSVKQHDRSIAVAISTQLPTFQIHPNEDEWKFGPGASYEVSRFSGKGPKVSLIETKPCNWRTYRLLSELGYKHRTPPEFSEPISRAIAVPKSAKTKRIITVEPTFNTLATQALRSQLVEYIKEAELNIFLDDQSFNRTLCLAGSSNGSFGTIDMHAASDSVTTRLICDIFRGTGLTRHLLDARVSYCDVKGEKVMLTTFAGMGNAVTFPVECIVFASIVEYVYRRYHPTLKRRYVVYGDDIVVERRLYDEVILTLEQLGFDVNKEKSYNTSHPFRESCGIEALGGHVVTPTRIPRGLYFQQTNSAVPSLLKLSNNLYSSGFSKAASAVRQWFRLKDRGIPYTDDDDSYGMLIWSKPVNSHLKSRYNIDLQEHEIRIRDFTIRMTSGPDEYRYVAWLMSRNRREDKISVERDLNGLPDIPIPIKVGSPIDRPRWCWKASASY